MARLSKFDREIKTKMDGLQGEPSARVWAGIREATPTASTSIRWTRVAAILLPLAILAGAAVLWVSLGGSEGEQKPIANTPQQVEQPLQPEPRQPIAEESDAQPEAMPLTPEDETPVAKQLPERSQQPRHNPGQIAIEPDLDFQEVVDNSGRPPMREQEQPDLAPKQFDPQEMEPEKEVYAEDQAPVEQAPEEALAPEGDEASNSQPEKRQFALRDLREMDVEEMKDKAGAFLGDVAKEGAEKLGVKTSFEKERIDEEHTRKKFAASFGNFSIKRVKRTKE